MTNIIKILEERFNLNMHRHPNFKFENIKNKLTPEILKTIEIMENTGGFPDVIIFNNIIYYVDFSKESPQQRRSFCYDEQALNSRKNNKPLNSVENFCKLNNLNLLTKEMYYYMQSLEPIDLKTSSWLKTEQKIRQLGGAIFGDNRYNQTFIYHNSAESYYSSRGFRTYIKIGDINE